MTLSLYDWLDTLVAPNAKSEQIPLSVFAILNTATEINPVPEWTQQAWMTNAIPLYYQTSMEPIVKYSPWLVEINTDKAKDINQWAIEQGALTWGWCYSSSQDWLSQIDHWRCYLRVNIAGKLSALRFQDPRLIALWLEQDMITLWQNLLATANNLYLPDGTTAKNLNPGRLVNSNFPWSLPQPYIEAWHNSSYGIKVRASNLDLAIWERSPELAKTLCQIHSNLVTALEHWLSQRAESGETTMYTSIDMAITALSDKKVIENHE